MILKTARLTETRIIMSHDSLSFTVPDRHILCYCHWSFSLCLKQIFIFVNSLSFSPDLVVNSAGSSPTAESARGEEPKVGSLSLKLTAMQERFSRLCSEYTTLGETCSKPGETFFKCDLLTNFWSLITSMAS